MSVSSADQELPAILRASEPEAAHTATLAVDVRGARKTYPNGLRALDAIDLKVREGDFATLLGPSGCGKSTLLRMIGGLSQPTEGSVLLWPGTVQSGPQQRLAFVFQSPP